MVIKVWNWEWHADKPHSICNLEQKKNETWIEHIHPCLITFKLSLTYVAVINRVNFDSWYPRFDILNVILEVMTGVILGRTKYQKLNLPGKLWLTFTCILPLSHSSRLNVLSVGDITSNGPYCRSASGLRSFAWIFVDEKIFLIR